MTMIATTPTLRWSDEIDEILGGDATAALVYTTPAGGAVALPVSPLGLRDRSTGRVSFTTSRGFGRKLDHLERDPRVALCYHSRDHGLGGPDGFVVLQGVARVAPDDPQRLAEIIDAAEPYEGRPPTGRFWDWWLRPYLSDRVEVVVTVHRVLWWPTVQAEGMPAVTGPALPGPGASQTPPAKGTAPRIRPAKLDKALRTMPHRLLAFRQDDGFPTAVPVHRIGRSGDGLRLASSASLPPGARRAGLLVHRYRPQLIGLAQQVATGWLDVGDDGTATYAPHTLRGFSAPPNKTVLLLISGLMARQQQRKTARRSRDGRATH